MAIVTHYSISKMLTNDNPAYVQAVIGRALVVLLNNQTTNEQDNNVTTVSNSIGFTAADAYTGCVTAKYWLKHKHLKIWMVNKWTKVDKHGRPRLAKYHRQLNIEAQRIQQVI